MVVHTDHRAAFSTRPSGCQSICAVTRVSPSPRRWNVITPACVVSPPALPGDPLVGMLLGDLGVELARDAADGGLPVRMRRVPLLELHAVHEVWKGLELRPLVVRRRHVDVDVDRLLILRHGNASRSGTRSDLLPTRAPGGPATRDDVSTVTPSARPAGRRTPGRRRRPRRSGTRPVRDPATAASTAPEARARPRPTTAPVRAPPGAARRAPSPPAGAPVRAPAPAWRRAAAAGPPRRWRRRRRGRASALSRCAAMPRTAPHPRTRRRPAARPDRPGRRRPGSAANATAYGTRRQHGALGPEVVRPPDRDAAAGCTEARRRARRPATARTHRDQRHRDRGAQDTRRHGARQRPACPSALDARSRSASSRSLPQPIDSWPASTAATTSSPRDQPCRRTTPRAGPSAP